MSKAVEETPKASKPPLTRQEAQELSDRRLLTLLRDRCKTGLTAQDGATSVAVDMALGRVAELIEERREIKERARSVEENLKFIINQAQLTLSQARRLTNGHKEKKAITQQASDELKGE